MKIKIYKTHQLPFLELRYISQVTSCDKYHQHEELTLSAIRDGNINILFQNKTDMLKPEKVSIVNPNEVHCAILSNLPSVDCYVMFLSHQWCQSIQTEFFNNTNYIDINTTLVENKKFYENFIILCDTLLNLEIPVIEKEVYLIDFVSKLFLEFCNYEKVDNKSIQNSDVALQIKAYLKENIDEDIILKDISQHMNLSIVHILRIFKKEFGLPIHSYILNKKVHLAKELLSTNIPIAQVAQMSGFFDQSHLNRYFKRVFQLTPKEYQKNIFS